ncbi:MAG: complex I NDUFA9 subunit family protein [Actinomycetota bacterium]
MKIAVAGGTGFLGRHIAARLIAADHEVAVLSRSPSKVAGISGLDSVRAIAGDVTQPDSLKGILDGIDGVVVAVQFPNHPVEVPRKGLTYDRYDRWGTENLLSAARASGVGRFFYVSGAGADPRSDKSWYRAKGVAERSIRSSDIEWAILRPSWAYGPEDRALNRIAEIARFSPVVPRLGLARQVIQPVWVGDIAETVARVFELDESWGRVYEIGGPQVISMDDVVRCLLKVMGRKRLVVPIPAPLAKMGTAPLRMLPSPPMTPQGIEFATQDGLVDLTAVRALGIEPVDLEEGLRHYMKAA